MRKPSEYSGYKVEALKKKFDTMTDEAIRILNGINSILIELEKEGKTQKFELK